MKTKLKFKCLKSTFNRHFTAGHVYEVANYHLKERKLYGSVIRNDGHKAPFSLVSKDSPINEFFKILIIPRLSK